MGQVFVSGNVCKVFKEVVSLAGWSHHFHVRLFLESHFHHALLAHELHEGLRVELDCGVVTAVIHSLNQVKACHAEACIAKQTGLEDRSMLLHPAGAQSWPYPPRQRGAKAAVINTPLWHAGPASEAMSSAGLGFQLFTQDVPDQVREPSQATEGTPPAQLQAPPVMLT